MVSLSMLYKRRGTGGGGRGGGGISSGGGSKGGSSSSGGSSSGGAFGTPGRSTSSGRSAFGGGTPRTVSGGVPFAGRSFGGASRSQISSGRGYGGGYYGPGYRGGVGFLPVYGLGFPFGFWPLYMGYGYYGNNEYGPHNNSSRPGGPLAMASFSSPSSSAANPPQYSLYGDEESVQQTSNAIQSQCQGVTVVPSTQLTGDGSYPSGTNTTLLPRLDPSYTEQYYRASSFALQSYFEDVTADSQATVNFTKPTPPPSLSPASTRDVAFQNCVNETISQVLPIEQGSWAVGLKPSKAGGAGAVALAMVLLGGGGKESQVLVLAMVALVLVMSG